MFNYNKDNLPKAVKDAKEHYNYSIGHDLDYVGKLSFDEFYDNPHMDSNNKVVYYANLNISKYDHCSSILILYEFGQYTTFKIQKPTNNKTEFDSTYDNLNVSTNMDITFS
jgi:hypothetical protein